MTTLNIHQTKGTPPTKPRGFTIIELITSIAILTVLITAFSSSFRGIMTLENNYSKETCAIIMVGNAIQRMAASGQRGPEALHSNCSAELKKNILLDPADTSIKTTDKDGVSFLTISISGGTPLVEIEL